MSRQRRHLYEFGPFRLDPGERLLLREGRPVPLQPKAFDTLVALVRHGGHLVEKDELMREVWPDAFVEEVNLSVNISQLRKALGERRSKGAQYIETVPRCGYRFVAPVREFDEGVPAAAAADAPPGEPQAVAEELTETSRTAETTPPAPRPAVGAGGATRREPRRSGRMFFAALAVALTAAFLYFGATYKPSEPAPSTPAVSLAVLPFRSLNDDPNDQYLGAGLADALVSQLSRLRHLAVRPASAGLRAGGAGQDPVAAGRQLQVGAVLEGSVQRAGGRIRVSARLVGVRDGATLWAEQFDEEAADILRVQDSVAERVALALTAGLSAEQRREITKRHTENAEAYRLYLMGRYIWNRRGVDAVTRSVSYFEQAVALDPDFALAHLGLADALVMIRMPAPEAERAVRRALEIDDSLGEAHASLGFILMFHRWDWAGAEREFRRAIELSPNYATAHHWRGVYLSLRGRLDEAKQEMRRALEIDPTSLVINADLGQLHYFAREYSEAEAQCRRALEMDDNLELAHLYLYQIYVKQGRHTDAFDEWLKANRQSWKLSPAEEARFRNVFAASGMRGVWQDMVDVRATTQQHRPMHMAHHYTHLGDREQALRWLERAYEEHEFTLPFTNVDPMYDDLRPDPRFQEIVRRVGLAE